MPANLRLKLCLTICAVLSLTPALAAQAPDVREQAATCADGWGHPVSCPAIATDFSEPAAPRSAARMFVLNQKRFWTGSLRLEQGDLPWLLPFALATAGAIASDTAIERRLPQSQSFISHSRTSSDTGAAAFVATAGGLYIWGRAVGDEHMRETGVLSMEALADSFLATSAVKAVANRERPLDGDGRGRFWRGGSSFPSAHAAAAWSVAAVVANQYPGPMTKLLAYGGAAAVTVTRVTGREHFASDALIGSALGWYLGRQLYRSHDRDAEDKSRWGIFDRAKQGETRTPDDMGSPYVPLDSWIYALFDRLVALGYVRSGFAAVRPWTRQECARLLLEAEGAADEHGASADLAAAIQVLKAEFSSELSAREDGQNLGAGVENLYARTTSISGTPLTDGYHFGQTLVNDFGRPYSRGLNVVSGLSGYASAGPFVAYVRGEYQQAPSIPALPLQAREVIATVDQNPVQPAVPRPDVHRFELLDSYIGLNVKNMQITFGRQSLWWGPQNSGPLMFSNNARPITMVRVTQGSPFRLPGPLARLGVWRHEFFFGQLAGHHFPAEPYVYGQKVSFKPTASLELGFSRMTILGGEGRPITFGSFLRSFASFRSTGGTTFRDTGDRRGGFDFSYRVPGLRDGLVLSVDSLVDDDPSPLAAPSRAAIAPGFYLPRIPGAPNLDLRVEAVYTDVPDSRSTMGQFIYWNWVYHDAHTQDGSLLGSWIGREAKGYRATANYWLSPRTTLCFGYRNAQVARDFIPGGVTLHDASLLADWQFRPDWSVKASFQYEHLNLPLLSIAQQGNVAASIQLTYWPHWRLAPTRK